MDDEHHMRLALAESKKAIDTGQSPFGAVIVDKEGKVIAADHNRVWEQTDITAHGEVTTIRTACKKTGNVKFEGCTLYSTTEPCPMCFAAIHWAGLAEIVYGASIADAQKAGFRELTISNEQMKEMGGSTIKVRGGILKDECTKQFDLWMEKNGDKTY